MHTLNELGPEQAAARRAGADSLAADNLIFSSDLTDRPRALRGAGRRREPCAHALVESGRWEQITAARLADDLAECGPSPA